MKGEIFKKISLKVVVNILIFVTVILTVIFLTSIPKNLNFYYENGKMVSNTTLEMIKGNVVSYLKDLVKGKAFEMKVISKGLSVKELMKPAFRRSFILFLASLTLALLIGIPKGILDSRRNDKQGSFKLLQTLIPLSIPDVLTISAVQLAGAYLFRNGIRLLGIGPILHIGYENWTQAIYPTIALSLVPAAYIARLTATVVENAYRRDYVLTARGKGCSEIRIIIYHTIKNVIIEIIAALPAITSIIFSSLFIVERIFYYPGIAYQMMDFYLSPGINIDNSMRAFSTFAVVLAAAYYIFYILTNIVKQMVISGVRNNMEV